MDDKDTPKEAPQVDPEAVAKQAEKIAQTKIEELKNNLVSSISGQQSRYGEQGPKSWDDLHEKIKSDAVTEAERRIEEKLKQQREEEKKLQEQKKEQESKTLQQQQEERARKLTQEWENAVEDGVLPDINSDLKAKLRGGAKAEDLTEEEKNDPGLKAYNEVIALHQRLEQEGKSASLYRTAAKHYNKQPAGANAPVLGSTPASSEEDGYSYDEVKERRKSIFGF